MPLRTDFTDASPMAVDHAAHHDAMAALINAASLPAGGTTAQVLTKSSGTDYAAAWASTPSVRTATTRLTTRAIFR